MLGKIWHVDRAIEPNDIAITNAICPMTRSHPQTTTDRSNSITSPERRVSYGAPTGRATGRCLQQVTGRSLPLAIIQEILALKTIDHGDANGRFRFLPTTDNPLE